MIRLSKTKDQTNYYEIDLLNVLRKYFKGMCRSGSRSFNWDLNMHVMFLESKNWKTLYYSVGTNSRAKLWKDKGDND